MIVKVKSIVKYDGHNVSANGSVNFNLKASYSELVNTIKALQLLNNDITIKAKIPGKSAIKIGMFRIKQVVIDGDGESKLKFNGLSDYIEMDNLNQLPFNTEETKEFAIMLEADIEEEEIEE